MRAAEAASLAPALAHSLTHAWIRSTHAWIDEGLAQFMGLLWTERTLGRARHAGQVAGRLPPALALRPSPVDRPLRLQEELRILSEGVIHSQSRPIRPTLHNASNPSNGDSPFRQRCRRESLTAATGDIFYRTKAAAVLVVCAPSLATKRSEARPSGLSLGPPARPRPGRSRTRPRKVQRSGPALVFQRLGVPRPGSTRPYHRQRGSQPARIARGAALRMAGCSRGAQ